ncbi:MAG: tetratricopeptide repeat protein [Anaerolineae bacterium]|nr:tetratricopeptide repeat protein [Anaerolineae bacterium]
MAGNRVRFEDAIQKANDMVWAERWGDAAKEYRRALAEFPDNTSAVMGYAWALLNDNKLDEARTIYLRLIEMTPDDPGPYERVADILEKEGNEAGATEMYLKAATCYERQELPAKMVSMLEAAVRLRPHNEQAWGDLLKQYQAQRNVDKAVLAALWLSYIYHEEHPDWAIEVCRQMQQFIPHDPLIRQTLMLLQSGRPVSKPPAIDSGVSAAKLEGLGEENGGDQGTPLDITRQRALEKLAESVFSEDKPQVQGMSQMEMDLLIGKAIDSQTRGDFAVAQEAYEQLLRAGASMPSIHFNLGLLYKEQMRFNDAIVQFQKSLADPEYVLGSHFALGGSYQALGNFNDALKHFLEAVKIVDLATVKRDQVDDLIRVYEGLAISLMSTGEPHRVEKLAEMLVDFMGQRGWEDESIKARERLDSLARQGTVLSLGELLSLPGSEDILHAIALAQEYQRRQKIYPALEEIFHIIGRAPDYLPLHHLLASLLMENGNLEASLEKYRIIARTYEIREQISQALATYQQILQISPLDIPVHQRIVDLLIRHGRIDDALDQYLAMADAYYQLAQTDRAREVYSDALRLAPRGSHDRQWEVRILHRLADLDLQRLDWQAAIKGYEEIIRIAPDDERAHLGLMRLYPRTGRPHLGMNALDKLLRRYLEKRKVDKALAVLDQLTDEDPDNIALRARAAQLYLNVGRRERALEHLDVLGELQLEAGQKDAAIKTIEAIMALDPPNKNDYILLYRQMTGKEPSPTP